MHIMKHLIIYIIIITLAGGCVKEKHNEPTCTFSLQQVDFTDQQVKKYIGLYSRLDTGYFDKDKFYVLDFFISEFSTETGFYVYIKEFDSNLKNSIAYYTIINNRIFFVPTKMLPNKIFKILPTKKEFHIGNKQLECSGENYKHLLKLGPYRFVFMYNL